MKISKKSWHYELVKGTDDEVPKTFCGYFWTLVGRLLLIAVILAVGGTLFILFPVMGIHSVVTKGAPFGNILVACIPWLIVFSVMLGVFLFNFITKKKDSLVVQFFLSVKNKYCPLVEYTEE